MVAVRSRLSNRSSNICSTGNHEHPAIQLVCPELTGARLAALRRVVALEGAVPLLSVAAVATGTGFGAAAMWAVHLF
jgi:hypothetical protein